MPQSAPRVDPRLFAAVVRARRRRLTAAEATRYVGEAADALGLVRPSYQTIRRLLASETARAAANAELGRAILDAVYGHAPPDRRVDRVIDAARAADRPK